MRKTNETDSIVWALQQRFDYNYGVGLSGFDVEDGNDGHLIINNRRKGIYYDVRVKFHHGEYNCKIVKNSDFDDEDSVTLNPSIVFSFDDPQEVVDWVIQNIAPSAKTIDINESRSRRGRLVKESRLTPRFTELLKEAYGRLDTDYSKLVFKCVEVTVNDKRYNASCKEGDVLDFDGLVELAKDYEPINGNVEFDVRTNQDTAEECLILSLSTSDVSGAEEDENGYEYEEGEELLVAEYWFTVRVEDNDALNDIGDEVIKQCYGD